MHLRTLPGKQNSTFRVGSIRFDGRSVSFQGRACTAVALTSDAFAHELGERLEEYLFVRKLPHFQISLGDGGQSELTTEYYSALRQQLLRRPLCRRKAQLGLRTARPSQLPETLIRRLIEEEAPLLTLLPEEFGPDPNDSLSVVSLRRWLDHWVPKGLSVELHCRSNPRIAPAVFLRSLAKFPCSRLEVHWPSFVESGSQGLEAERPSSRREAVLPTHGHWFADLFRLWWVLDSPAHPISSFQEFVSQLRRGCIPDISFHPLDSVLTVDLDGNYHLPQGGVDGGWAKTFKTGQQLTANSFEMLERVRGHRFQSQARERLATEFDYFRRQACDLLRCAPHAHDPLADAVRTRTMRSRGV